MKKVIFDVPWGDRNATVEISQVVAGSGGYHIYIDRYYNGQMVYRNNEWVAQLNEKSELSLEDIQVIREKIEEMEKP